MLTKEIIKNSLDAKWRKRQMRIWLVITGIYIGVILFSALIAAAKHGALFLSLQITGIYSVIMLLVIAPFLIYNIWCYYSLLKNPEEYEAYEVMLDKPETSYLYRGAIYYTVRFTDKHGNGIVRDTRPLWSSGIFDPCQLADYNNKKVFVAYRESTDTLIVLGKDYK